MLKNLTICGSIIGLIGAVCFVTGCGEEPPAPAKPKVITQKIAVATRAKPAKPAAPPLPAPKTQTAPPAAPGPSQKATLQKGLLLSKELIAALLSQTKPRQTDRLDSQYDPKGKIDPFVPLFRTSVGEQTKNKQRPKGRLPLTPLEKIDLSQLKLVGIINGPREKLALVEEASGKGYIVRKGTYMGVHAGKVVEILNDKIQVEEEIANVLGKTTRRMRELTLQKRAGEQ